jgi:hypothetical protein
VGQALLDEPDCCSHPAAVPQSQGPRRAALRRRPLSQSERCSRKDFSSVAAARALQFLLFVSGCCLPHEAVVFFFVVVAGSDGLCAEPVIDMSSFYNARGGYFVGEALVSLAAPTSNSTMPSSPAAAAAAPAVAQADANESAGTRLPAFKRANELRKGDKIQSFRRNPSDGSLEMGVGEVAMVYETLLSEPPLLVTLRSGLQLMAWHPVVNFGASQGTSQGSKYSDENSKSKSNNNNKSQWVFPAQMAASRPGSRWTMRMTMMAQATSCRQVTSLT